MRGRQADRRAGREVCRQICSLVGRKVCRHADRLDDLQTGRQAEKHIYRRFKFSYYFRYIDTIHLGSAFLTQKLRSFMHDE